MALRPWPSSIGSSTEPLARIKVDETNCFGMIEWQAVREAASRFLQAHGSSSVETSEPVPC